MWQSRTHHSSKDPSKWPFFLGQKLHERVVTFGEYVSVEEVDALLEEGGS